MTSRRCPQLVAAARRDGTRYVYDSHEISPAGVPCCDNPGLAALADGSLGAPAGPWGGGPDHGQRGLCDEPAPSPRRRGGSSSFTTARRAGSPRRHRRIACGGPSASHRTRVSSCTTACSKPIAAWNRLPRRWTSPAWRQPTWSFSATGRTSSGRSSPGPSLAGRVHYLAAVPPDEVPAWVAGADVDVMAVRPVGLNQSGSHAQQALREPRRRCAGRRD